MPSNNFDYQRLDTAEAGLKPQRPWYRDRTFGIIIGLFILFITLHFTIIRPLLSQPLDEHQLISTNYTTSPSTHGIHVLHSPCGSTPSAARARGCIFDPNSFLWTHPRCHNPALIAEFLALKDWTWYEDISLQRKLSVEEVMTSEFDDVIVTMEYHVQHCLFMWKMMHAQALGPYGKMGVDSYIANMTHTNHCAHMLGGMRGVSGEEANTRIFIKYPDCGVEEAFE